MLSRVGAFLVRGAGYSLVIGFGLELAGVFFTREPRYMLYHAFRPTDLDFSDATSIGLRSVKHNLARNAYTLKYDDNTQKATLEWQFPDQESVEDFENGSS